MPHAAAALINDLQTYKDVLRQGFDENLAKTRSARGNRTIVPNPTIELWIGSPITPACVTISAPLSVASVVGNATNDRSTSAALSAPSNPSQNMIGPSPSYIPSDYNDIHAGIFTNPLAEHDPNFYPSPEHVAAASYGAPYDGYVNGNTAAQPAINDYSRSSQSVSPRTGYEGWKEANEPYITPDPNNPNLVQPSGATTFAANGDHQFNFQSPLGPHNTTNQDTPYNPSSQHTFSSPNDSRSYTDAQMNNFQITNYAHDLTSTPESSHYSSPPTASATFQGYENTTMHPLPVLFASDQVPGPAQSQPYYNPVANTSPTRFTIHEGRKIAGTARAQRSNTSLSTGGIKTGTTMGSGVSPATSFSIAQSNPYSPSYGQQPQQRSHSMQQPSSPTKLRTSSTPFPTSGGAPGQTVGQVSTSNSKKRTRHEPSESLSVPAQRYGNLLQTVATGATTSVNHTNQFPVRFESGATTATFEDDSDTEESDAADGPTGGGSQRGPHRGGKANATRARGKKGAAGQGRAGEVARL
ncbi:hypothetical protein FRB99_002354 [Tulasnella sp. 403]|nr:hypothetical protein FRB99_002354 [Tulasnella sp. 403]